jgi:flagellar biosynthesis component FlhA
MTTILAVTVVACIILVITGTNPFPVLFLGVLLIFLIYALWNPPQKHKDFSYKDQQKATSRALGGSGPPDLSQLKPQQRITRSKK